MKKGSLLAVLFIMCLHHAIGATGDKITGFWLDAAIVNQMARSGATSLKIYAANDAEGNPCYLMTARDSKNKILGSVHMQSTGGICPPQCEFRMIDLGEGTHTTITSSKATEYVESYRHEYPDAGNCAKFSFSSLEDLAGNSAYIKVDMGSSATASGYGEDGRSSFESTVSGTVTNASI